MINWLKRLFGKKDEDAFPQFPPPDTEQGEVRLIFRLRDSGKLIAIYAIDPKLLKKK